MFSQLDSELLDSMNLVEFYWHILPVYSMLKDAHSMLVFPFDYSREYESQEGEFIPLEIEIRNEIIYVKKNLSGALIPLYSAIISINGVLSADILANLKRLANHEIPESEAYLMSLMFKRVLYPLYGFDESYAVLYVTPGNEIGNIQLDGILLSEFKKRSVPNYSYEELNDCTGVLTINLCEGKNEFPKFCDSIFVNLNKNKIPNLIIDVRNNPGGSTFHGDTLFSYLTKKKYTQYPQVKIKMSSHVDPENDSTYFLTYDDDVERSYRNPEVYTGNVYMIANQNSFSSATLLAATFQCYKIGPLVGQETGGVQVFHDEPVLQTLSNTGIRFLVSHQYRWCPCGEEIDRGIIPDYTVSWSKEDAINGIDSEMEFIIELIQEEKKCKR
jgi:hypothetical protein